MSWLSFIFKKTPKSFLGVDMGTSAVRIVELGRKGQTLALLNYGEVQTGVMIGNTWSFSGREMAKAISAIIKEAGIYTKEVNFSIPDFSSFFTSFELPPMSQKEMEQAVRYEARSYIPLPLSDITLDWQVVNNRKVLVAAIPNDIIAQYQEIASASNLNIKTLEAEVFALARPLTKVNSEVIAIIDIGARSTTCNIFEKGNLEISHSFNVSGNELTEILSRALKVDHQQAEDLKKTQGLMGISGQDKDVKDILLPLIDSILLEAKKTFQNFRQQEQKDIKKVLLAGGSALMPGLKEYFAEELKIETEIANPFLGISAPPVLAPTLKEMGPSWLIAVGLAMKGLE